MSGIDQANYLDSLPNEESSDLIAEAMVKNLNANVIRDNQD